MVTENKSETTTLWVRYFSRVSSFWGQYILERISFFLFYKSLLAFLTFVNCEVLYLQASRGISWQPLPMFDIMFAQLRAIPRTRNKFVEVIAVTERYFIIAHVENKESKMQPFQIWLSVKLTDERMSIKKRKICLHLNYNILILGKMAGKTESFSYWENLPLFWMMLNKASADL